MEERDETRACKICNRAFKSGRALGGHMRSHLSLLKLPPHPQLTDKQKDRDDDESDAKNGEGEDDEEGAMQEEIEENFAYALRENRRKSFRFSDPEFSFTVDDSSSAALLSVTASVHDSHSDTEEQLRPTGKRFRRRAFAMGRGDPSPANSFSDMSTEEDVAVSLMLLSRDPRPPESFSSPMPKGRRKFQCGICLRVFPSYQALGGHRAGYKKSNGRCAPEGLDDILHHDDDRKIHKCPFCFRVFASGQALGGHKRIHVSGDGDRIVPAEESLLDLNLPAVDDSTSVVSYADFLYPHNSA